jgi:hypothetical protein
MPACGIGIVCGVGDQQGDALGQTPLATHIGGGRLDRANVTMVSLMAHELSSGSDALRRSGVGLLALKIFIARQRGHLMLMVPWMAPAAALASSRSHSPQRLPVCHR